MKKRIVLGAAVLLLALAGSASAEKLFEFSGTVEGHTRGVTLFRHLVELLNPESMEMIIDQEPDNSGKVRHIYLDVRGAVIDDVRIENLKSEATFAELNPIRDWAAKKTRPLEVRGAASATFEGTILEEDVNALVRKYLDLHTNSKWRHITLDFRKDSLFVKGYYHQDSPWSDLAIEVTSGLEVKGGKELWLKDYRLVINTAEKTDLIHEEIRKVQPLFSLRGFTFPVSIDSFRITPDSITFSTLTKPKPFTGRTYRFTR
jgi:hypothetical protein